jgi:hypothetical protein
VDLQCPFATDMCSSFFLKKSDKGALSFMKREIKKYTQQACKKGSSPPMAWAEQISHQNPLSHPHHKGKTTTTKSSKKKQHMKASKGMFAFTFSSFLLAFER